MKAFFIYKDGKLVGNPIGYTTKNGALKSLVDTIDWHKCKDHISGLATLIKKTNLPAIIPEEMYQTIKEIVPKDRCKFVEKEFEIVFKDEN